MKSLESIIDLSAERFSRRTFSQRAIAATAILCGGSFPVKLCAAGALAPSDVLTCGVVGAGGMASFHAANNVSPYLKITAVCDVDRTRAESFNRELLGGEARLFNDYHEVLGLKDIDVLLVCTPDHWHTKVAVDALRSGKDVYCEKPLTLTVGEGKLIRSVLAETEQVLQVGTQQRSDPRFQTAVALARSGRLGAIQRITVAIGGGPGGGPFPQQSPPAELRWQEWLGQTPLTPYIPQRCHGNFRWWYEYSGGKMTDWGAHHVDIAHWALNPTKTEPIHIHPEFVELPVPFEDGVPTVTDCYNTATRFRVRCEYPGGAELVILHDAEELGFDNGILFECEGGRFFVNRGKLTGAPVESLQDNPLPDEATLSLRKGRDVMTHMANFYASCHTRTEGISDVSSHLEALNICHLANVAMRLKQRITWHPGLESTESEADRWLSRPQREGFEVV